ncbi:MAG TPA: hypothetical protein VK593_02630 [Edaphobacter sp.]|nr:hypothetical protein [Edaphobacter sp.]
MNEQKAWSQMQEDLKKLSTRSRRILAKGSTHNVHRDRSELVVKEVLSFLEEVRGAVKEPASYGSTVVQ